jgi:dTDP-glucose 4,6-dehydratase
MKHGRDGEIYHLSPDNCGYAVHDIVQKICVAKGRIFDECIEVVGERLGQDAAYLIDSTKAKTELDWRPQISADTGISEVVDWVDANIKSIINESMEYIHKT